MIARGAQRRGVGLFSALLVTLSAAALLSSSPGTPTLVAVVASLLLVALAVRAAVAQAPDQPALVALLDRHVLTPRTHGVRLRDPDASGRTRARAPGAARPSR